MKRKGMAWGIVVALGALCSVLAWAWWPTTLPATAELPFDSPKAAVAPVGDSLRLMTWNLHGLRKSKSPTDVSLEDVSADQARLALRDVIGAIGRIQPDILLLQGVDRSAKRSGDLDQVAGLRRGLPGYPHAACAPVVQAGAPFGLGESGLCVFSKHRIIRHARHLEQAAAAFAPVDAVQSVEVAVGRKRYRILNVELFSTTPPVDWLHNLLSDATAKRPGKSASDPVPVLAAAVASVRPLSAKQMAPLVDVLAELAPSKAMNAPAIAPATRRTAVYLAPAAPLVDMRVALEAGESAAELPVVVNLLLKTSAGGR